MHSPISRLSFFFLSSTMDFSMPSTTSIKVVPEDIFSGTISGSIISLLPSLPLFFSSSFLLKVFRIDVLPAPRHPIMPMLFVCCPAVSAMFLRNTSICSNTESALGRIIFSSCSDKILAPIFVLCLSIATSICIHRPCLHQCTADRPFPYCNRQL